MLPKINSLPTSVPSTVTSTAVPTETTINVSPLLKSETSVNPSPYIFILLDTETQESIKTNLQKVLQKIGTSSITKLLHPIIEQGKLKYTAGMTDLNSNTNLDAQASMTDNKLNGFYINMYSIIEPEDRTIIVTLLKLIAEINNTKTKITDNNDYILAHLVKNRKELSMELVSKLNYFKAVDIIYEEYLVVLAKILKTKQNIYKIIETISELLGEVLWNLIQKLGGNNVEIKQDLQKLFLLYLIQHYSNNSITEIKMFLLKSDIINEEEYKNFLRLETLEDVSKYLTINGIINISPNSLRNSLKTTIGETGLELLEGTQIERFIAYLILNKNQNSLYSNYLSSHMYKTYLDTLEGLVMNAKSYIAL
jgi:hypothetical protein